MKMLLISLILTPITGIFFIKNAILLFICFLYLNIFIKDKYPITCNIIMTILLIILISLYILYIIINPLYLVKFIRWWLNIINSLLKIKKIILNYNKIILGGGSQHKKTSDEAPNSGSSSTARPSDPRTARPSDPQTARPSSTNPSNVPESSGSRDANSSNSTNFDNQPNRVYEMTREEWWEKEQERYMKDETEKILKSIKRKQREDAIPRDLWGKRRKGKASQLYSSEEMLEMEKMYTKEELKKHLNKEGRYYSREALKRINVWRHENFGSNEVKTLAQLKKELIERGNSPEYVNKEIKTFKDYLTKIVRED